MGTKNRIDDAINALQITLTDIYTQCMHSIANPNGRPSVEIKERVSVSIYGYNFKVKNLGGIKQVLAQQSVVLSVRLLAVFWQTKLSAVSKTKN